MISRKDRARPESGCLDGKIVSWEVVTRPIILLTSVSETDQQISYLIRGG